MQHSSEKKNAIKIQFGLGKNIIRDNVEDRGARERLVEQAASNNGAFPWLLWGSRRYSFRRHAWNWRVGLISMDLGQRGIGGNDLISKREYTGSIL